MDIVLMLIFFLFGIIFGGISVFAIYAVKKNKMALLVQQEKADINRLTEEAKTQQREIVLQAKDEALHIRQQAEEELKQRRAELAQREQRLSQKEENLEHKAEGQTKREHSLNSREQEVAVLRQQADEARNRQVFELERVAAMSSEQARETLIQRIEDEARHYAGARVRKIEQEAREKAEAKARQILSVAVSRVASDYVSEAVVSTVPLPSDEMKGRIIGREGRNIRAFELATGVDLIVDDTPEAVTLSCFDPVRREIAKRALARLVADGRIHQARIEETVAKAKQEVEQQLRDDGEKAAYDAGVQGVHPEILTLVGRLRYRTSYGQNQLYHAVEVSRLAGVIATELGANVNVAKTAALLHDIGKVMDSEIEGPHALIGADLIRRLMKTEDVAHAVGSHHGEEDPSSVEAWIVMAADALSGGRPGARREQVETYVRRLEALEEMANAMEGVERCFAIQAGREVRILVRPDVVDDVSAMRMAHELSRRIEENLQYPGQIKVTVIRETRASDYAK